MTTYLTTAEAAEQIRTRPDYVIRQCANGAIKAKKLGNQWRISQLALDEFMAGDGAAPPTRDRAAEAEKRMSARQKRRSA